MNRKHRVIITTLFIILIIVLNSLFIVADNANQKQQAIDKYFLEQLNEINLEIYSQSMNLQTELSYNLKNVVNLIKYTSYDKYDNLRETLNEIYKFCVKNNEEDVLFDKNLAVRIDENLLNLYNALYKKDKNKVTEFMVTINDILK